VILGSLGGVRSQACVTQSRERLTLTGAASISDWPGAAKEAVLPQAALLPANHGNCSRCFNFDCQTKCTVGAKVTIK